MIAKTPDVDSYTERGELQEQIGNFEAAAKDAAAARALDPSDMGALKLAADVAAHRGALNDATRMLDERISVGGKDTDELRAMKADLVGTLGDPQQGLALIDELIASKPGRPELLNVRCWIKGTRNVSIDNALKDCTSGIELTDNTAPILDSRALVWLRMGKLDAALSDVDAALLQTPNLGASRFLRALVLKRLGRMPEAERELLAARRLTPGTETDYRRFGLTY